MKKKLSLLSLLICATTLLGGDLGDKNRPQFKERYPSPPPSPVQNGAATDPLAEAIAGLALATDKEKTPPRFPSPPPVERCVTILYDGNSTTVPWNTPRTSLMQDPNQEEIDEVWTKTNVKLELLKKNYQTTEGPSTHASRKKKRENVGRINTLERLQADLNNHKWTDETREQDLRGTISLLRALTS